MPIVTNSRFSYPETIARLQAAIVEHGNTIFAAIDQASAAKSASLNLRPTTLIIFGNPKAGTQLMDAYPLAALDLPLKIAVWEDDGVVNVAYTPAADLAERYAVVGKDALIAAMDAALAALAKSIA